MSAFYTVFRKKHPLMFSIITPAFLGRFLYFLYQWKEKWIPYNFLTYLHLDDVITASPCMPQKFTSYSYFLTLNILSFELNLKLKSWSKTCENVKDFLPEDWQKILFKKMNIRWLSAKVANNWFDRTHSRKRSSTVVSKYDVVVKFVNFSIDYSFMFPLVQKV